MTSLTRRLGRRQRRRAAEGDPAGATELCSFRDDTAAADRAASDAARSAGVTATTAPVDTGVPVGVQIASAWSWRVLVIAGAVAVLGWVVSYLSEVVIPILVAVLLSALLVPVVRALQRLRLPRGPASGLTVVGMIIVISGLLTLAGTQISSGFSDLSAQVGEGIKQLRDLARGNLGISDAQITQAVNRAKETFTSGGDVAGKAAALGTGATHFLAGLVIALFATFFFLYQGERIWAWVVRLLPRRARDKTDSSGRRAWVSLTAFVRATVIVAAVDAIGIAVGAWILGLPLVPAIGILVFISSFVPIVGAVASGAVAVLVGLVDQGFWVALIMLGVVVAVNQLESHVLQPFLLGRAVSVHPLAVILAIAAGVTIAGIVGALLAVPCAAVANAVVNHLAGNDPPAADPGPVATSQ
jgi:predicted PurR-regulated permease PerM